MTKKFNLDDYNDLIAQAEQKYDLPKGLLYRQARQESSGNPDAKGKMTDEGEQAQGLMQLLPSTAKSLGVDPLKPEEAIPGAARLMRENIDRYKNIPDAVSAYHGGTDKAQWGEKTKDYVNKVLADDPKLPPIPVSDNMKKMQEAADSVPSKLQMMRDALDDKDATSASTSKFQMMQDALNDKSVPAVTVAEDKSSKPTISPAEDVVESIPTGIIKGIDTLPQLPGNLYKFASQVGTQAGNKLHNIIHPESAYTPAQQAENIRNAGNDAVGNFLSSAPTINQITGGYIPKVAGLTAATIMNPLMGNNLNGVDLREAAMNYTGENALHAPQTKEGRIAENIAAAVPQGRILGATALPTIGGAAGATIANEISPDNPAAQLVGSIAGGAGGKVVSKTTEALTGTGPKPEPIADNVLTKAIKNDSKAPSDVADKLAGMGDEAMLADAVGENTRGVARAIANMPGPAKEIAIKALEERQAGQADRIEQAALTNLKIDPEATYHGTVDDLMAKRAADSAPLYEKALQGGSIAPLETQFAGDLAKHDANIESAQKGIAEAQEQIKSGTYNDAPEIKELEGKTVEASNNLQDSQKALREAQNQMTLAQRAKADAGDNVYRTASANNQIKAAQEAIDSANDALNKAKAQDAETTKALQQAREAAKQAIEDKISQYQEGIKAETVARQDKQSLLQKAQSDAANGVKGAVWNPRIQQFLSDPIMQQGLRQGLEIQRLEALAEGKPFNPSEYGITGTDAEGNPIVSKVPNMRLLDAGKRGLDSIIESYRDPTTGKLALDQRGRAVNAVKQAYVEQLDKINPDYAAARKAFSGPSQSKDAMDLGRKFASNDPSVNEKIISRLSDSDKDFFRIGVGQYISDVLQNAPDAADSVKRIFGSPAKRAKLASVFPDAESFKNFEDTINNEREYSKTYHAATQGSRTTPLREDIDNLNNQSSRAVEGAKTIVRHGVELGKRNMIGNALYLAGEGYNKLTQAKPLSQSDAIDLANKLFTPNSARNGKFPVDSSGSNRNLLAPYIDSLARGSGVISSPAFSAPRIPYQPVNNTKQ